MPTQTHTYDPAGYVGPTSLENVSPFQLLRTGEAYAAGRLRVENGLIRSINASSYWVAGFDTGSDTHFFEVENCTGGFIFCWASSSSYLVWDKQYIRAQGGAPIANPGGSAPAGESMRVEVRGSPRKAYLYVNGVPYGSTSGYDVSGYTGTAVGFTSAILGTYGKASAGTMAGMSLSGAASAYPFYAHRSGSVVAKIQGTVADGTITSLQWRLKYGSSNAVVSGYDWQTISHTLVGSTWTINPTIPVCGVGHGGWLIEVRDSAVTSASATTTAFRVGHVDAGYGQSNKVGNDANDAGTPADADVFVVKAVNPTPTILSGGGLALGAAGNLLKAALNMPVLMLNGGFGGRTAAELKPNGGIWDWDAADTSQYGQYYWDLMKNRLITVTGGDCNSVTYNEGESVSASLGKGSYTSAQEKADLTAIYDGFRSLTGRTRAQLPFILSMTAHTSPGLGFSIYTAAEVSAGWNAVRKLQLEWATSESGVFFSHNGFDVELADGLHYTDPSQPILTKRYARTILYALGVSTERRTGAKPVTVIRVGSTVRVSYDLWTGTSLSKPSSAAASSFEVFLYSDTAFATPLTLSDVQIEGSDVVITLASDPGQNVVVRSLYYAKPDRSNMIVTNYSNGDTVPALPVFSMAAATVLYSGSLSFAPGETTKTITLQVAGDTTFEADETFTVALSNPSGATISVATAVGTITNDDSSPDVTAPTLSSASGTSTGQTTGTSTVSTNEANGTLYSYLSTSSTPPTSANLKSGSGSVAFGSQSVSATGTQTKNWTGLTAGTQYYTHWLHSDLAGNESAIVTGPGFTTDSSVFLRDTFTDTNGTLITAHTGEIGATWTAQTGYSPSPHGAIQNGAMYSQSTANVYQASGTPPNANYYVDMEHVYVTAWNVYVGGPAGRMDAAANTLYFARWNATGFQLFKTVAGTTTQLGSTVSDTLNSSITNMTIRLSMNGSTIKVLVSKNGGAFNEIISVTDTSITAAGKAGVRMSSSHTSASGIHVTKIEATPL